MYQMAIFSFFVASLLAHTLDGGPDFQKKTNDSEWKLEKDKNGIKIYTRHVEGYVIKEFKAIAIVEADIEVVLAEVLDADHLEEWMSNIATARNIEIKKNGDYIMYYQLALPWPMQDRDAISENRIIRGADSTIVITTMRPDYLPEDPDLIRMRSATGGWVLKPIAKNRCQVIYQFVANPSTKVPGWIANMFIVDSPYETIKNLKERLEK